MAFSNPFFLPFMVACSLYSTVLRDRVMLQHHGKSASVLCCSKFPTSEKMLQDCPKSCFLASHPLGVSYMGNKDVICTKISKLSMPCRHIHWIQDQMSTVDFLWEWCFGGRSCEKQIWCSKIYFNWFFFMLTWDILTSSFCVFLVAYLWLCPQPFQTK